MERFFLIDGHAQIFRMYYAFSSRPLINSKGVNTSILFGFTKMILELIEKEKPTHIAVVFDSHAKTFRHLAYKEYKANRPPAPDLVREATEPLKKILHALNIQVVIIDGVEADDVIGSMTKAWAAPNREIYMVTPDKDYGQLIGEGVFQYKLSKNAGEGAEIVNSQRLCAHYGIHNPKEVIDLLAIWGDSSDNVPGIRGIGEVGAKKLIGQYGSVLNMTQHIEEIPTKTADKIKASLPTLEMSLFLVTIKTDVALPIAAEDIKRVAPSLKEIKELFDLYEFKLLNRYLPSVGANNEEDIEDFPAEETASSLPVIKECGAEEFSKVALQSKELSLYMAGQTLLIETGDKEGRCFCLKEEEIQNIGNILTDITICKTGILLKNIYKYLWQKYSLELAEPLYDLEILHYLINPEVQHTPEFMIRELLDVDTEAFPAAQATPEVVVDLFSAIAPVQKNLDKEKIVTSYFQALKKAMCEKFTYINKLYDTIEMPLIATLAKMEITGVKVDIGKLSELRVGFSKELALIEQQAKELSGSLSINLSSPKQIGVLLFETLGLGNVRKTANGSYPTDEQTLHSLEGRHPIVGKILEYRALKKLLSTYIDALPLLINRQTGRIHTTFNQALTATGRLSSNNPNLQNIPVRTERGKEIRKAFIPSEAGGCIVAADYSQIELRLMAHLSGDEALNEAFSSGEDVHAATAAKLFHTAIGEVTPEQRRKAKTVNFGIIYGISPFGLAERMDIGLKEAKEFIEAYFQTYPQVSLYMNNIIAFARANGYVETIYGRRRYLGDINSKNVNVRKFNERNAINAPIQGSAADIIKIAMAHCHRRLEAEHLKSKMILQVHDELVFDVASGEKEAIIKLAKEEMESVIKLKVPLIADIGYGNNWLEAH